MPNPTRLPFAPHLPPRPRRWRLPLPSAIAALLFGIGLAAVGAAEARGQEAPEKEAAPTPEKDEPAVGALLEQLAALPPSERPPVARQLIERGAEALPAVEKAREATGDADLEARLGRIALWITAGQIVPRLEAAIETQLSYDGQHDELSSFGREGVEALLAIVDDAAGSLVVRVTACRALADVGDPSLLVRLREIHGDVLLPRILTEQIGVLMAIFGDRHAIERDLEEYEKLSRHRRLTVRIPALNQLANLNYRIRDYAKAVEAYEEILRLFDDLVARQEKAGASSEILAQLREEQAIHYYNAACSNSLYGDLERCRECLRRAVRIDPTHYENMEKDGDLRRLREDPSYADFRRELGKLFEGKSL